MSCVRTATPSGRTRVSLSVAADRRLRSGPQASHRTSNVSALIGARAQRCSNGYATFLARTAADDSRRASCNSITATQQRRNLWCRRCLLAHTQRSWRRPLSAISFAPTVTAIAHTNGGWQRSAGVAQFGRATAFQAVGRAFESRLPLRRCRVASCASGSRDLRVGFANCVSGYRSPADLLGFAARRTGGLINKLSPPRSDHLT